MSNRRHIKRRKQSWAGRVKGYCRRLQRWSKEILAIIGIGVLVALIWYVKQRYYPSAPAIDANLKVTGIDVSKHNGYVDMKKVAAAGHTFVYVKTSEGISLRDAARGKHASRAVAAGLKVGAYHYFIFKRDGKQQASNFLASVKGMDLDLPLAIDVEQDRKLNRRYDAATRANLRDMVNALRAAGHRSLLIYTNGDGYKNVYKGVYDKDPDMDLWLCSFQEVDKVAHRGHIIQQYDHHGYVKGVKGEVDLNVYRGSTAEWNDYLKTINP